MRYCPGFSILELLILILLLAVLALLTAPGLETALRAAREARAIGTLRTVTAAEATFFASAARFALPAELFARGALPAGSLTRSGGATAPPNAAETLSDGTYLYSARYSLLAAGITLDADPREPLAPRYRRFRIRLGRQALGRGGGEGVVLVAPPSLHAPRSSAYRPLGQ